MYHTPRTRRRGPARGFTLLEVLLVLAILVILATVVTVALVPMQDRGYSQAAQTQISAFEKGIKGYRLAVGTYPQKLEDLIMPPSGITQQKWGGPHLEIGKGIPKDPWGNEYVYTVVGDGRYVPGQQTLPFTIVSAGPDLIPNTEDDISNLPAPGSTTTQ